MAELKTRKDLISVLNSEEMRAQIAAALPRHLTPERMLRVATTAIRKTPQLLQCNPMTVLGAVVTASQLGLEPDGVLGHAYLIPYGKTCTFIPGYKGLLQLARRSGEISTIEARVIRERDSWSYSYGLDSKLVHVPCREPDTGELVAAYAVAKLKDGGVQWDLMLRHEIDAIRSRSRAGKSGPWVTDYEEMAKKTVLRRLCKMLPVSVELQRAVALDECAEVGVDQGLDVVDLGQAVEIPDATEEPEIDPRTELLSQCDALAMTVPGKRWMAALQKHGVAPDYSDATIEQLQALVDDLSAPATESPAAKRAIEALSDRPPEEQPAAEATKGNGAAERSKLVEEIRFFTETLAAKPAVLKQLQSLDEGCMKAPLTAPIEALRRYRSVLSQAIDTHLSQGAGA